MIEPMSTLKDQILELRTQGKAYNEIVALLGCSKGTVSYYCGTGQLEKTRSRRRDRRSKLRKYVQEYKQSHVCADCGENYPYWMMELDHTEDNKYKNLAAMISSLDSLDAIIAEIEKCEVVCANDHKNRTWYRMVKHENADILDVVDYYGG